MKLEIEPNTRERVFRAFLDLIILQALAEQPMTGYKLSRQIHKKFGLLTNPSMIYSYLKTMEKRRWIKQLQAEDGKTYCLTEQGRRILSKMGVFAQEIHVEVKTMMGS